MLHYWDSEKNFKVSWQKSLSKMDIKSIGNSVRMLNKINNRLWIENYEL